MLKITVRTDQLLCNTEATGSKVHQWGSKAETDGREKSKCSHQNNITPNSIISMEGLVQSHDRVARTPLQ